jgi:superfamily II DNA or RNA helicase
MEKQNLKNLSFEELYKKYYEVKRQYQKSKDKKLLVLLKAIQIVVDTKDLDKKDKKNINQHYQSYPDYNDPEFTSELSKKAEFFHCKSLLDIIELDNKCIPSNFELGNHQKFLKNFMNKNTPYKGALIFHGVGVGKTCTAVTISNSFIEYYKKDHKKIICLVSKNIQSSWMNTIYDPNRGDNQCNAENFQTIIKEIDMKMNTSKKVKKLIKEYYEFYGYQQFSNKIKKLIEIKTSTSSKKTVEEIEKLVIKKYFSNRLLIIDEVHNLRDDNLDNFSKDTIKYLDKVIKYSDNLRILLLSATPMFNKATEIQWLLNLLLKNDKRPTISKSDIFNEKEGLSEKGIKLLIKKSRGYVSYVRGENPITFPIRLYPEDNKDPLCINGEKGKKYPTKSMKGNLYSKDVYKFKFTKLYYNQMNNFQSLIYNKYVENLESETLQISEQRMGIQMSNIVYPNVNVLSGKEEINDSNYKKLYGGSALLKNDIGIMKSTSKRQYKYSNIYRKMISKPLFDLDNIGLVSAKIKNLLEGLLVTKSKGIIFIYSEFIPSGILPLSFALEHLGFEKYSGNVLDYPEWKKDSEPGTTKREPIDYEWNTISQKKSGNFKRAKYITLTGNSSISPNNNEEIKELVSNRNKNGENIKIVIGNVVASEGLDLKNIREIHILDPWYHLSRIEQIIGRGIRFCSHLALNKEDRNVTVYMHVAGVDKDTESIDTYTYRIAEEKASLIGKVETILKENAIDCYLNKQINHIKKKQINPLNLVSSRGIQLNNFDVSDKKYSKICSFRNCNFDCNCEDISDKDINYDTFSLKNAGDLFLQVKKIIKELYEINNYYHLDEIVDSIINMIDTNISVIYYALFDIIDNKYPLWNHKNISGYLINKNEYYIFQPHINQDLFIPMYYRSDPIQNVTGKYLPLKDNLFVEPEEKVIVKVLSFNQIRKNVIVELSKQKVFLEEYTFEKYIKNFIPLVYPEYIFDNITYQNKYTILRNIVPDIIDGKQIEDQFSKKIIEHFKDNLLYEENLNYYILEPKNKIVGFFIFNTESFYKKKGKQLKELDNIIDDYDFFIYKNSKIYNIKNLTDGELIRESIKMNFLRIKDTIPLLKTSHLWGYPFKLENESHVFKLVDSSIKTPNKLPGRIISQIAKKNSVRAFIRIYFKENYDLLIENDPDIENQSKSFLYLLIEMIFRNKEKIRTKGKRIVIPYDLIFLKYIE